MSSEPNLSLEALRLVVTTLLAAGLAFIWNRLLDARRARRDVGGKIVSDLRSDIRDLVEVSADYWAGGIDSDERAKKEARIRLFEQDVRETLALFRQEVGEAASSTAGELAEDLLVEVTAYPFESIRRRSKFSDSSRERARKIAAIGGRFRAEVSKVWRSSLRPKRRRTWAGIPLF